MWCVTRKPTSIVSGVLQPTAPAPHSLRETMVETSVGGTIGGDVTQHTLPHHCDISPPGSSVPSWAVSAPCWWRCLGEDLQQQHILLFSPAHPHLTSAHLQHRVCSCTDKPACFAPHPRQHAPCCAPGGICFPPLALKKALSTLLVSPHMIALCAHCVLQAFSL